MVEWTLELEGDDWEEFAGSLLRHRHPPSDVQSVPAIEGDLGIDYWIRGRGDIYQCYGAEVHISRAERLRIFCCQHLRYVYAVLGDAVENRGLSPNRH